jgi:hypothetical protein
MEHSDNGEQSALDMRITRAGVDKIPLARLDKRGCKEWDGGRDEKGRSRTVFAAPGDND